MIHVIITAKDFSSFLVLSITITKHLPLSRLYRLHSPRAADRVVISNKQQQHETFNDMRNTMMKDVLRCTFNTNLLMINDSESESLHLKTILTSRIPGAMDKIGDAGESTKPNKGKILAQIPCSKRVLGNLASSSWTSHKHLSLCSPLHSYCSSVGCAGRCCSISETLLCYRHTLPIHATRAPHYA